MNLAKALETYNKFALAIGSQYAPKEAKVRYVPWQATPFEYTWVESGKVRIVGVDSTGSKTFSKTYSLARELDERAKAYDSNMQQVLSQPVFEKIFLGINKPIYEKVLAHADVDEEDTVIELFAGAGGLTRMLAETAEKVVACDSSPAALAKLKELATELDNVEVQKINYATPSLKRKADKVVYALSAQSHPNPFAVYKAIAAMVPAGDATIVENTPFHENLEQLLSRAGLRVFDKQVYSISLAKEPEEHEKKLLEYWYSFRTPYYTVLRARP